MSNFLIKYRGLFVILFILPASLAFKAYMGTRNRLVFWLNSAPEKHDDKVKTVQQQVLAWQQKTSGKIPMCTARPGWQAMSHKQGNYKKTHYQVDVSLMDILEINEKKGTVRLEPMASMGQISALLKPLGWSLAVVPELDALTVGGLINGFGIESSSHKYGLFQAICESLEIITADGKLVKCSKEENSELFYAIPWSYGSLGFLVCAEIKIVPSKDYVHISYIPYKNKQALIERFSEESLKPFDQAYDFIEGLMYSEQEGVLMLGNFADTVPAGKTRNALNNFWKPWFYEHVRKILNQGQAREEYIPLRHYYHRHTRSFFWEMAQIIPFGNSAWFRYLLGWMSPPEISLIKLTETEAIHELYDTHHMDQDFLLPLSTLDKSLTYFHQEVDFYPLWLCPMRVFETPIRGMVNPLAEEQMFVDVGIYGEPNVDHYNAKETTRKLETFIREMGGFQALYADTFQTREEFRKMFDHTLLDKLREQTGATKAFPEPFDKVSRAART
ncbi:MAG: FAD-binding oxidoreductase [Methyloprofundus sp.]|nr:FAD-binding oxidoreductase [Methyloprofundus sp.]MDT8425245.1 FAD-binding oxidoreductase [Methyloprofundus sp.]